MIQYDSILSIYLFQINYSYPLRNFKASFIVNLRTEKYFSQHCDIVQKQPSRGVLRKRCSENMLQIYRRTAMPKCDFTKVAKQLY